MPRMFKAVLLWLVAVAIPLQGMAAALMPSCAPAPAMAVAAWGAAMPQANAASADAQAAAARPGHGQAHAAASAHAVAATDGVEHAAHVDHVAVAGHAAHGDRTDTASHSGHGALKCCSTVLTMAATADIGAVAHVLAGDSAPSQPVVTLHTGVVLDGLDRPPRRGRA